MLVLGLTYREGVKELAYTRALPLIERLRFHGAQVCGLRPAALRGRDQRLGVRRGMGLGLPVTARAVVLQTADPRFRDLDLAWLARPRRDLRRPAMLRGMPARRG